MAKRPADRRRRTIASLAPTIASLIGVAAPRECEAAPLGEVNRAARSAGISSVARCLVFAPDAIGFEIRREHDRLFRDVVDRAQVEVNLKAVSPTYTPVCFASMFTGAPPAVHGIRKYEKPVVRTDTLFDALVRAGRRAAIIAVENSSMDLIFRDRNIDYFSEDYDPQVTERVLALIEADKHDLIVAYQQEYDDTLHKEKPFTTNALHAVANHVAHFARIAEACDLHWRSHDRAIIFAPDHGAHVDDQSGTGAHGTDLPADLFVSHFYGLQGGTG